MTGKWINDAGHGGVDTGAVGFGNTEKVYTLEAALYVDMRLREHGINSLLTRDKDITLTEDTRVNKVRSSGAKYCISHHFNAGSGNGTEFIHSIYADGQFERILLDEFKKAGYPLRATPIYTKKYGNNDYYYMHRRTGSVITTIIEYDFVDGPNKEKIKDIAYRQGMYEAVVKAVCRFEKVAYKPIKKETKNLPENKLDYEGHWAETSIKKAIKNEIMNGYQNGDFGPNDVLTRGQFAAVLDRLGLLE